MRIGQFSPPNFFHFQSSVFKLGFHHLANVQFSIFNFQFWHLTLNLSFFLRLVGPVSCKNPDSGYEKRVIDPSSVGRPNFLRNSRYPAVSAAEKADTSFSSFSWWGPSSVSGLSVWESRYMGDSAIWSSAGCGRGYQTSLVSLGRGKTRKLRICWLA